MPNQIPNQLAALMAQVFTLPSPADAIAVTRDDGGAWDSLRHMELIFAVEDAFGVRFTEGDLASIRNYRDLVARIEALKAGEEVAS